MDKIAQLRDDIIKLNIQGATNVAFATLEAVEIAIKSGRSVSEIQETAKTVAFARPTEPLAQNSLKFIFADQNQTSSYYLEKAADYENLIREVKTGIVENASSLIKDGGTYLTHCHSSSVVSAFTKAQREGRKFSVFVTETRPRFQGRITAREFLEADIENVTMVVDSAALALLESNQIEAVFLGADLLGKDGFVNKVGSLGIARMCEQLSKPIFCITTLLKFDTRSISSELLEDRGGKEIWSEAPEGLKFYAPSFDYIPYDTGIKIVCEKGILESANLHDTVHALYPWI